MNEGWGAPEAPIGPTAAERLDQLTQQMTQLHNENVRLQDELLDLRQRPRRGGPGALPYRPDPDRYLIPRPPRWTPLGQGPIGNWDADDQPAFLGVRPILMKTPEPFKGNHDDMDCFIGDCNTYFEVFHHQFRGISSLMVIFMTSHFLECMRNW